MERDKVPDRARTWTASTEWFGLDPIEPAAGAPVYDKTYVMEQKANLRSDLLRQKAIIEEIMEEKSRSTLWKIESEKKQTIKIFRNIQELAIGTYRYGRRADSREKWVTKQFIPMFPHLYLDC